VREGKLLGLTRGFWNTCGGKFCVLASAGCRMGVKIIIDVGQVLGLLILIPKCLPVHSTFQLEEMKRI
jgi:hypothetical protein